MSAPVVGHCGDENCLLCGAPVVVVVFCAPCDQRYEVRGAWEYIDQPKRAHRPVVLADNASPCMHHAAGATLPIIYPPYEYVEGVPGEEKP